MNKANLIELVGIGFLIAAYFVKNSHPSTFCALVIIGALIAIFGSFMSWSSIADNIGKKKRW